MSTHWRDRVLSARWAYRNPIFSETPCELLGGNTLSAMVFPFQGDVNNRGVNLPEIGQASHSPLFLRSGDQNKDRQGCD